jgi:glutathione S-transferase
MSAVIKLYRFPPLDSLPSASPFCIKVEAYLRMAGIEYESRDMTDPRKAPKGKLPFIRDGDKVIADSAAIIDYLKGRYGDPLDKDMTAAEQATALAYRRMMEEHTYFCIVQMRWMRDDTWSQVKTRYFSSMPAPLRWFVPGMARNQVRHDLRGQGIARHTDGEIDAKALEDVRAISNFLGDKAYFLGAAPTSLDATGYGFLTSLLRAPFSLPIQAEVDELDNLAAYCERLDRQYFTDA